MTKYSTHNAQKAMQVRSTSFDPSDASAEDIKLNYKVAQLVSYGFSNTCIAELTGLTWPQVQHRVRMYKLQGERSAFRMGVTENAKAVIKLAMSASPAKRAQDQKVWGAVRNSILAAFRNNPRKRS